jgi:hypothetical protein
MKTHGRNGSNGTCRHMAQTSEQPAPAPAQAQSQVQAQAQSTAPHTHQIERQTIRRTITSDRHVRPG